jgi:hypothetical protein
MYQLPENNQASCLIKEEDRNYYEFGKVIKDDGKSIKFKI